MRYKRSRRTSRTVRKVAASAPNAIRRRSPETRTSSMGGCPASAVAPGCHKSEPDRLTSGQGLSPVIESLLAEAAITARGSHRKPALLLLQDQLRPLLNPCVVWLDSSHPSHYGRFSALCARGFHRVPYAYLSRSFERTTTSTLEVAQLLSERPLLGRGSLSLAFPN